LFHKTLTPANNLPKIVGIWEYILEKMSFKNYFHKIWGTIELQIALASLTHSITTYLSLYLK